RVLIVEAPRTARPLPGVVDADARAARDARAGEVAARWPLQPEDIAAEVRAVQRLVDVHRAAEQARTPGLVIDSGYRLQRPQQHGVRYPLRLRHHIQAVPEPVDEIHVGMAGRSEHDLRPWRTAAGGVGSEVLGALVRLGLDYPAHASCDAVRTDEVHAD